MECPFKKECPKAHGATFVQLRNCTTIAQRNSSYLNSVTAHISLPELKARI